MSEPSSGQFTVSVVVAERLYAALVGADHTIAGEVRSFPEGAKNQDEYDDALVELPADALFDTICDLVLKTAKGHESNLASVGVALPGLMLDGTVLDAPNLPQLKGVHMRERLCAALSARGIETAVTVLNDADAVAAGLASKHGRLEHFIRVWTLGTGIGYGCYPFSPDGIWEGGHTVVTLDNKETYCGCGGRGHLEGIMGHRAMRLRFLDMEPEEVFEAANRRENPDQRCLEFKRLWHKGLAAATASSIHMAGTGRFYVTGFNTRFLDLPLLKEYLHQMVKMSPIQSYSVEVVEDDQMNMVIGTAVAAQQAATR